MVTMAGLVVEMSRDSSVCLLRIPFILSWRILKSFGLGGTRFCLWVMGESTEEDEEFWEVGVVDSKDIDVSGVLGLSGEV